MYRSSFMTFRTTLTNMIGQDGPCLIKKDATWMGKLFRWACGNPCS